MSATLVHFGSDLCSRLLVLERLGYRVYDCGEALSRLDDTLRKESKIDAIIFTDCRNSLPEALLTSRSLTDAPFVSFETHESLQHQADFDLVIAPLTPPEDWLKQIDLLLQRSKQMVKRSELIRQEAAGLQSDSAVLRKKAASECERSIRERKTATRLTKRPKD